MKQADSAAPAGEAGVLDPAALENLERAFTAWAAQAGTAARRSSRLRVLLIFLLIRYTGAKLSEVLGLVPGRDIDLAGRRVTYLGQAGHGERAVHISEKTARTCEELLSLIGDLPDRSFGLDPAFVRRKFYERAQECGFDKKQGGPEMIRKARAVELMRNNMPLPAVQRLLGHSTPNLTTSYMSFSDEDMAEIARLYMEREGGRASSARNRFFGKVRRVEKSAVQSLVELATPDGNSLTTLITNTSAGRLNLEPGRLLTAEVKAPWLILERCDRPGTNSAENTREGRITGVRADAVNVECSVGLEDGSEMCAIVSARGFAALEVKKGDRVRLLFSANAVILHTEG